MGWGVTHLALDQHVEEVLVRLCPVAPSHQVAQHRPVVALIESETGETSAGCQRPLRAAARDVGRLRHGCGSGEGQQKERLVFRRRFRPRNSHFLRGLGGDGLLPLSWTEQRWSSIRLLWKRLSRSKKPSSPRGSEVSR